MVRLTGVEPVACRLGGGQIISHAYVQRCSVTWNSGERRAESIYCLPLHTVR